MSATNLFPNYQAVALTDSPALTRSHTFTTDAIAAARDLVKKWGKRFDSPPTPRPSIAAVIGDYGTGKTHLLLDAAAAVQDASGGKAFVLRLIAPEDTPSGWFRMDGSPLKRGEGDAAFPLPFRDLLSQVMTTAAIEVAGRAPLTRPVAAKIKADPEYLRDAIADNKLNLSEVEAEFQRRLDDICGKTVSEDVKTALAALNSTVTAEAAGLWLSGIALTPDQTTLLRVHESQAGEAAMLGLLVALAALLNFSGRGLVLMIDELEHLADYDRSHGSKENLTWLKRLLEALAPSSPLVFVAGHSDAAWALEPNLLTRFADHIRLVVLSPADICRYIEFVLGRALEKFEEQAQAIHEATGGKMRDVLTLCSYLSDESDGFTKDIDPASIRAKTGVLQERAIDAVQGLLQEMGYSVRRNSTIVGDSRFDLAAYRFGAIEVVFDFQHVVTQESPKRQIKPFIDRVREVAVFSPDLLVCRVAEGNADTELTTLVQQSGLRALYFDTKSPDFLTQIRDALRAKAPAEPPSAAPRAAAILEKTHRIDRQIDAAREHGNQTVLDELRQQRHALDLQLDELRHAVDLRDATFEQRLEELENRRRRDFEQLRKRTEQVVADAPGSRDAAVAEAILPKDKLETTYASIVDEYSPARALRIVAGRRKFILDVALIAAGVAAFFVEPDVFPEKARYNYQIFNIYYVCTRVAAVGVFFAGILSLVRAIIYAQRFYEHARRLLRETYVRLPEPEALTTADTTLQEVLAKYGPREAMWRAREQLSYRIPLGKV